LKNIFSTGFVLQGFAGTSAPSVSMLNPATDAISVRKDVLKMQLSAS
jgi:ATP-dependent protease HslVU (ClpYQ) peptidase subunit